ncbi:MAG TPA: alpha/beta hydrolase [Acidimicrobiales bacterium]|nr:alpha/beta hydrolase [Acidimicrobiales bacterium]
MTTAPTDPADPVLADDPERPEPVPPVPVGEDAGERRLRERLVAPPTLAAAGGALLCWFLSLMPSLLPRQPVNQAAISAVSAAFGLLVFGALGAGIAALWRRQGWRTDPRWPLWGRLALIVDAAATISLGLVLWTVWQRDHREVMGMDALSGWSVIVVLVLSVVLLAVLVLLGRLLAAAVGWLDRRVGRRIVRPRWGRIATAGIVVVTLGVVWNVFERQFVDWADTTFGLVDTTTPDGVEQPTLASASGGPGSLVEWDTLGFQGRGFAGGATPADEIAATARPGVEVRDPIRVYVGLDSADSVDERADIAVRELERTGAFDRSVLVVATATGTGWINPVAARAIEHLHGGDTAIVSQQYSFLPSWIAFLVDTGGASEAGVALFDAVHARWSTLPADDRPTLVVFGESLGSFGAEAAFASDDGPGAGLADLTARADGALLVGPTANNPLFSALIDERDAGSPSWRPTYASQPGVRVANQVTDIDPDDPAWTGSRVLYLFHPTDAIGTWRPDHLWSSPDWLDDPRGVGVPDAARWVPVISWVQESFDLMAGFSAVPGFGHDYTDAFVDAWAAVAPPEGWTTDDTAALRAALADR